MLLIPEPYAPIEEIKLQLYHHAGIKVFLKREDLSHPFISGNKWRKLKYHLLEAHKLQAELLITFGGPYSNHILATAAAGAKYGFKTIGIIRGEEVNNPVLNLAQTFGMQLTFTSRSSYKEYINGNPLPESILVRPEKKYSIPEGGGGAIGEQGITEMVDNWTYTDIICSVGTGSTLKGLINGMIQQNNPGKVHGIVVLKGAENMKDAFTGFPVHRYQLHFDYHEGGYGKSNPELMQFIQAFASETGILLDQVYEGKMIKALHNLIEKGFFPKGSSILALHNGGLTGLLSQL